MAEKRERVLQRLCQKIDIIVRKGFLVAELRVLEENLSTGIVT
jgi:hypothetical protein